MSISAIPYGLEQSLNTINQLSMLLDAKDPNLQAMEITYSILYDVYNVNHNFLYDI